jgi:two-component system, sensor histidine kinase RegB
MLLRKPSSPIDYSAALDTAEWIVQLRWFAVFGQCLAIAVTAGWLLANLPLTMLSIAVSITVITNIALMIYLRRQRKNVAANELASPQIRVELNNLSTVTDFESLLSGNRDAMAKVKLLENLLGSSLLIDVVTLTAMLYLTGGIENPFSCFYFANIAVCGLILAPRWTWAVSGLSVIGVVILLIDTRPLPIIGFAADRVEPFLSIRKQGSFLALATCCIVVTYFINVLMNELRNREMRLANAEAERMRSQRLEALATLAAGAGHELASPLSTIAVVAKELSRKLDKPDVPKSVTRDVDLIRSELERCKQVLHRLKSGAGEASAEGFHEVPVRSLVDAIVLPLREPTRIDVYIRPENSAAVARLPLQALSQAIRNLIQNALDASPSDERVTLEVTTTDTSWVLRVTDRGSGMDAETVERIGQPFFTTKSVGKGMGLGVFLARNVVRGLGGELNISSQPNEGTTIIVQIPITD